jgi:hypothetical protein
MRARPAASDDHRELRFLIVPEPLRAGTHLTALAVAERVAELLRAGAS